MTCLLFDIPREVLCRPSVDLAYLARLESGGTRVVEHELMKIHRYPSELTVCCVTVAQQRLSTRRQPTPHIIYHPRWRQPPVINCDHASVTPRFVPDVCDQMAQHGGAYEGPNSAVQVRGG